MYFRFTVLCLSFLLLSCSGAERSPSCVPSEDGSSDRCESNQTKHFELGRSKRER